ncbi:hypothetical protein [Robiginitalea sp.]|uniref:hypothetical protein n=1 Tax=Robiginitalea sp. TaxID=1902411 RepID=UPI003C706BF6
MNNQLPGLLLIYFGTNQGKRVQLTREEVFYLANSGLSVQLSGLKPTFRSEC